MSALLLENRDHKIQQAFSRAADRYEQLTSLHQDIGRDLIDTIEAKHDCSCILDVGMGTGWLTGKLANKFGTSHVVGLDFAKGMVDAAQDQEAKFSIVHADAVHLPFKDEMFDIIVSNLAFQWFRNLTRAFKGAYAVLKPQGVLYLSMFGKETFHELFSSLENTMDGRKGPFPRLSDRFHIQETLREGGFRDIKYEHEHLKVRHPDMFSLLKWIKDIGANLMQRDIYIGKDWLHRANEYYCTNFSDRLGTYTTFELIKVEARK